MRRSRSHEVNTCRRYMESACVHCSAWCYTRDAADAALWNVHTTERCNEYIIKSLFTENSAATQEQYSTSINTNKIQYKMQRSSPSQYLTHGTTYSSFSTKLNYLLHLITKLAKAIHCGNVSINLSCFLNIRHDQRPDLQNILRFIVRLS